MTDLGQSDSQLPDREQTKGRPRVAMRRQVILDDLRGHPLSSSREISQRILAETGGPPALVTGAVYIPPWTVLNDLNVLHKQGLVHKFKTPEHRVVSWQAAD